ncbi:hypothetical protein HQ585_04060, partial [candidate division KSB1 bacterium]|nr:hypothetical protein [candidate division KSB1 bacterium]
MKRNCINIIWLSFLSFHISGWSQNCFLEDWEPKTAQIPPSIESVQPGEDATVTITFETADTLGRVSKYIFGNAVATWTGNIGTDPVLLDHLQTLAPTFIRYPGGSWSDIFFWDTCQDNAVVGIPDSLIDGTTGNKDRFWPQHGANCGGNWRMTWDNYNEMRWEVDTQGLITVNYGYARYGTSEDPVAKAAHLAAEWVREDDGQTLFWEVGNENAGPWEAGWQIDPALNHDGQPEIISGELYGQHFQVFVDSMRKAATEIGVTIYIGAQILHYNARNDNWNPPNITWNEGVFREVGDAADFWVIHNYFGNNSTNPSVQLNAGLNGPKEMMNFIKQDIIDKGGADKPIALTEWNITAPDPVKTSIINGMQSVLVFCEMAKLNYGLSSRWLVANWDGDGMFYKGDDSSIPAWNPRPAFFYTTFLQKVTGDHVVSASTDNEDVSAYASTFSSGEAGVVVVNKGTTDHTIQLRSESFGMGDQYYVYSLTGEVIGDESENFPLGVNINGYGPDHGKGTWGPVEELESVEALAYPIFNSAKILSPARSVQFILVEDGENYVSVEDVPISPNSTHQKHHISIYPSPAQDFFQIDL